MSVYMHAWMCVFVTIYNALTAMAMFGQDDKVTNWGGGSVNLKNGLEHSNESPLLLGTFESMLMEAFVANSMDNP